MSKKLTKSNNRIIAGVCSGLAEYLNFDVTVVRLLWCVLSIFSIGAGIVLYIVGAVIMPNPDMSSKDEYSDEDIKNMKSANIDDEDTTTTYSTPHSDDEFNEFFKK